jgi:hypothetical protein
MIGATQHIRVIATPLDKGRNDPARYLATFITSAAQLTLPRIHGPLSLIRTVMHPL